MLTKYTASIWTDQHEILIPFHSGFNRSEIRATYEKLRLQPGVKATWSEDIIQCEECLDTGIKDKHWGPNDGCSEFMDVPEIQYCQCKAGEEVKEDHQGREDEAAMAEEAYHQRRYEESAGYEIRL